MSWDILIKKNKKGFKKLLLETGGREIDGSVVFSHDRPSLSFSCFGDSVALNYGRNHFNLDFLYSYLKRALEEVEGFSFNDPQTTTTFTVENSQDLDNQYIAKCVGIYVSTNTVVYERMTEEGAVAISGASIPIAYPVLQNLSQDIFFSKVYKTHTEEKLEAFFPTPFTFVDLKKKKYLVSYTWSDFIDQVFPAELTIDLVSVGFWDNQTSSISKTNYYRYPDLVSRLPKPDVVDDPIVGKRLLYKGISRGGDDNYSDILNDLKIVDWLSKSFRYDPGLVSFLSIREKDGDRKQTS